MLISILTTLTLCMISAGLGSFVTCLVGRCYRRDVQVAPQIHAAVAVTPPNNENDVDILVSTLYELTSMVNSQVSQHTLRVNEITNSLDAPGEISSAMILVAGKTLIAENQKLQVDLQEAKEELKQQRELIASCMQDSLTDALTNVANRRAFDRELNRMFSVRRRKKTTFSVLILDIDHFKRVNDEYGHMVGDQLLKLFCRNLTDTFRDSDFVARFGGEEFVVILPQIPLAEACKAADRVRNVIANTRHKIGDVVLQVTASIGAKEIQGNETPLDLLEKVDKALYTAKNSGRNCCYYHDGAMRRRYVPTPDTIQPESSFDRLSQTMNEKAAVCDGDDSHIPNGPSKADNAELVLQ